MNNPRKFTVILLIGVMIFSMLMLPFTPNASVDSDVSQALPETEQEFVEKWADRVENDMVGEKMDPMLVSYMDTGVVDEEVRTMTDGSVKLLLYMAPGFDTNALNNIADVNWQIDLVVSRVASVSVDSVLALKQLEAMDGIAYVQADRFIDRSVESAPIDELDMFHINDVVGATDAIAAGYDGTGAIVAIDDSGVDFSHPDLIGTEYNNGTYGMSYDPSGVGLTAMTIANGSFVADTTAWLTAGNLLTYKIGSSYYVNVSDWNPICNYNGAHRYLLAGGFVSLYETEWGIANATNYIMSDLWNDWEIPDPVGGQDYTFGWAMQQRNDGYAKVFAPSMIYDGDVIIDWNGTYAWTNMWMDGFWWESADFTNATDRAYYAGLMDWSFVDDIDTGYVHDGINNVLAADLDDDGVNDVGLGSLSWAYDDIGYLLNGYDDVFFGITPDWLGWNCLFTHDSNHGHWTASTVASRGVGEYDVYANTSVYKLPGVANGSRIMACKGISNSGGLMADFWGAGFHLNATGFWTYEGDGPSHHADIVSNSWGWGPDGSYLQLYYYALMYDMASVPTVLGTGYPGTLFIFSAGNDGNDYGTTGTPGGSYSVVSVGASTTSHYYEGLYGNVQTDSQQAYLSATGPAFTGVVKPDVMAPGFRGVNPQPFHNTWVGAGDPYVWWQGTSLSCPVAAGVAAIIIDAYVAEYAAKPTPQMLKNLLLSTATDMGIDPFAQGHGLVNAAAAVDAIENTDTEAFYFESDSFANYGVQVAEAWLGPYGGYDSAPFGIYMPSATPVGMESSSIFFGSVSRGDAVNSVLNAWDFAGTAVGTSAFDSIGAYMMEEYSTISFPLTSSTYNDTNFEPNIVRPMTFDLSDEMTLIEYTEFLATNYATIQVSFDADDIGTVVRLFDWSDDITTGYLNYWNFTTGVGDVVDHVSRATDPCNLLTMRIGHPSGLANLFDDGVPALQLDAPTGTEVTVTITIWEYVLDPYITLDDGTTYIDVQLDVPMDAEYGVHQGQIEFVDGGGAWYHMVPYSYMVDFDMDGSDYGGNQTLVDGVGATHTPYDTGATTTAFIDGTDRPDESGGIDVFRVNIPYDPVTNATIVVIRAEWENDGTVIDFQVRNLLNGVEAETTVLTPTGDKSNVVVWDYGDSVNGSWWFLVYTRAFDGASVPEDIRITFQLYNDATFTGASYVNLWESRTSGIASFAHTDVLVGDHVKINNNWTVPAVSGLPEYDITSSEIALLSGLYVVEFGTYADPQGVDDWPVALSQTSIYKWETVEGIQAGDNVRITLDAQYGADPSFDVWNWEDADSDNLVDLGELGSIALLSLDVGGGDVAESGAYTAAESGDIAIRVFCWAYSFNHQDYELSVDSRVSVDINSSVNPEYAEFDTYELLRNSTMVVQFRCYTATDVMFFDELGSVSFFNFFKPEVTVNAPVSLGSDVWNLTWSSTDQNADDTPYYSVWLSNNGGASYMLLRQNTTSTFYLWDASGWLESNYIVRVRAYSCDFTIGTLCGVDDPPTSYWPGDFSDGFSATFLAGDVKLGPALSSPVDIYYPELSTGHSISWTANDLYPVSYVIYFEGMIAKSGAWNSSAEFFTISVDGHGLGSYNYTIAVTNLDGLTSVDTVFVYVIDGTSPNIDDPADIQYNEFTIGHSIIWDPSDLHPAIYAIYLDGIPIKSGFWNSSSETIMISVDGHGPGEYNYTLLVADMSGNSAFDDVLVTVVDSIIPTIDSPIDVEYTEGDTGITITWNPLDFHPLSYEIFIDGFSLGSHDWSLPLASIIVSVDGHSAGEYNYTIVVTDVGGNTASDSVTVTVTASSTTTTTTTTTSTTTTTTNTTTTTTTDVPPPVMTVIIIIIIGAGGAIVVIIVIFVVKKN
ncbi:MAG: S8 family serine peptidase [Candidatus Thorarchaeota archaeon]